MAKAGKLDKQKQEANINLLPKMLHIAKGMQPLSAKAYADMIKAKLKDDSGNFLTLHKKGLNKKKLVKFVHKYYKFSIISHNTDADKDIPIEETSNKVLYNSVTLKPKKTDQMPSLSVTNYNELVAAEKYVCQTF